MIVSPATRVRPARVLALGGLSSFGPLALDMYLPALPAIAVDLGTTESATQLSLSACMVGLALGQLLVGPVTDRVGRRRVLVAGVALFTVSAALCALAPSIEVLLVLRLFTGLSGGAGIVIARSMARDLYHGRTLARVYAQLMLVSGMAPVVGPLLGGQLLRFTDWRGVFGALAAIGLVLLTTALAQAETLPVERRRPDGVRDTARVVRALLSDRTFLPPALALGLGLCAMFTYIAMGSFVLQDGYGLSAQAFSLVSAGNALGIVVLSQVSAVLVRRVRAAVLLGAGAGLALVAAAVMLAGVLVTDSVVVLLVPLFVLVACTGLIVPNATALALERQGSTAGSASAVLGVAHFGVAAVVPPLASLNGVSALVLATTTVLTAAAAAAAAVVVVRTRTAGEAPDDFRDDAATTDPEDALATDPDPAPSRPFPAVGPVAPGASGRAPARPEPVPPRLEAAALGRDHPGEPPRPRRRRLEWVAVDEPGADHPVTPQQGWLQPVGPATPGSGAGPGQDPDERHVLGQLRLEYSRRREWRRIADRARQSREGGEPTARPDTAPEP